MTAEVLVRQTNSQLQSLVDPRGVVQMALDLIRIPSPTGHEAQVAEFYAESLRELGLEVELDEEFPGSPSVVAYLNGGVSGPTLELGGHLDTIPVPHEPPVIRDGLLYGRGAEDMKGGLAAMYEVARVLARFRDSIRGRLLICAWGRHEAPAGRGETVASLVQRGIHGDAVINVEGPCEWVPIIGKGMSTFEVRVEREGPPLHELNAEKGLPHALWTGFDVLAALKDWGEELAQGEPLPYVGPESLFVGQIHSGDFYNRVPNDCRITGTRRYAPDKCYQEVLDEFEDRLEPVRSGSAAQIRLNLEKTRDGFRLSEDEPVVRILQQAHEEVTGTPLPCGGISSVGDVSVFVNEGGVPAVYYGTANGRAHATPEYVPLVAIERQARVLLSAAARFLSL